MAVGGTTSLLAPLVGFDGPLRPVPLAASLAVAVVGLCLVLYRSSSEFELRIPVGSVVSPLPLALLLLPFASVLGTAYMKLTDSNLVLLGMLLTIAVLPLTLVWRADTERWYAFAVWCVSTALLYHGGLWPYNSGHQLSTVVLEQGRWIPNYGEDLGSLLPNGVLYPTYAQIADISIGMEFDIVNPFLISLLPVFLFLAFRKQTDARKALIGVSLFMFSFPFFLLYPSGGRVSTPVFFLVLTALAVSDDVPLTEFRRVLILVFGAGIAVSHYGTAWVVMAALTISVLLLLAVKTADRFWPGRTASEETEQSLQVTDGGTADVLTESAEEFKNNLLRGPFVAFYSAFAMAWYLYTGNGGKFRTLPSSIVGGLHDFFYESDPTGDAVRSATQDYSSVAISTSRQLYLLFGALMGIGVLYVAWMRVVRNERLVEDEFLALGAGFLAILGTAFLPFSTGFNTARVMMIVFMFTAPFLTFGVDGIITGISRVTDYVSRIWSEFRSVSDLFSHLKIRPDRMASVGLTVLLAMFLLLNSGVVSEFVTKDYAPSNAVGQERLLNSEDPIERGRASECIGCQIQTHIWILGNKAPDRQVYGDFQAEGQIDYYRTDISAGLGSVPRSPYGNIWDIRNGSDSESYMIFLPYNTDTGGVTVTGKYDWREFNQSSKVVQNADRIYVAGDSRVYLTNNETGSKIDTVTGGDLSVP